MKFFSFFLLVLMILRYTKKWIFGSLRTTLLSIVGELARGGPVSPPVLPPVLASHTSLNSSLTTKPKKIQLKKNVGQPKKVPKKNCQKNVGQKNLPNFFLAEKNVGQKQFPAW